MAQRNHPQEKSFCIHRAIRLAQLCMLLLCFGLPYSVSAQKSSDEKQPTDDVIEFLLAGDWDAVRKALSRPIDATHLFMKIDTPNPVATMILGHALMNSNHNHLSLPIFGIVRDSAQWFAWANWCVEFRKHHPYNPVALYFYADAMFRVGDYKAEEIALNKAIRTSKPLSYLYHNRGQFYIRMGSFDLAMTDLDSAIAIDSNLAEAYYHRGLCLTKMKKPKQAILEYGKAIRKNAQDTKSYVNLSTILQQGGVHKGAIQMAHRALALDQTATYLHFVIAQSHEKLNRPRMAIEYYENFLKSDPSPDLKEIVKLAKKRIKSLKKKIKGSSRRRRR